MFKLRLAILVAGAALAFGAATVMAMPSGSSHDQHGALVSKAAQTTCRTLASEARGDCVSAIASTEGQENKDGARAKAVAACKVDNGDDATETAPTAGDKAAQAKDRAEDHAERMAIVACITGKAPGSAGS